jgi:beta-galactosidase
LIFSAHDGRDKLVSYLGPIDSVDRKGLFGRALLVKGQLPVTSLTGWQMLKVSGMAALSGGPPPADIAGWQPYAIGTDAFARHEGYGWFRVRLPDTPTGVRQICLHFGSVDEDATVFIGNRRIMRHEGWNRPFSVTIDGVDTLQKPLYLTLFIENRSNEGGIDKSVTVYPLVDPVPVTGWTLQGGPGKYNDALLNSLDSSKPARATMLAETGFRLPVFFNSPWLVWRVIPKGLGHGSVWVNGHNLGRYPEKIPINGLYVPSCWLKVGENDLRIFDEDGNVGNEVYIGLEKSASRKMITYIQP